MTLLDQVPGTPLQLHGAAHRAAVSQVFAHRQVEYGAIRGANDTVGGSDFRGQEGGVHHAVVQLVGPEHLGLLGATGHGQDQQGKQWQE